MGTEVSAIEFTGAQRRKYRKKLEVSLTQLRQYLEEGSFSDHALLGLELELNLIDHNQQPAMINAAVLEDLQAHEDTHHFELELGKFNIELNHPVLQLSDTGLRDLETSLTEQLSILQEVAQQHGATVVPVGILPTLAEEHFAGDEWLSPGNRFKALDHSILTARGEDIALQIHGPEQLDIISHSIGTEAACTSMQLHLEVTRERFGAVWNAAQALAGPQLALAANSPIFLEKLLWSESRIPVYEQSADTRPPELRRQGVRPRVWFGESWITGIDDLYQENVDYFPSLLPDINEEHRTKLGAPTFTDLNLHNGTIWRWNRPIFDPGTDERPANLRVENRLLPAGPTPIDMVANAAFFFGAVKALVESKENPWERMAFSTAKDNFYACAQHGLNAEVYWPGSGVLPVTELLDRHLIPLVKQGLEILEVDAEVIARYLEVLTGRNRNGRNGATWMTQALQSLEKSGASRPEALATLTRLYASHSASGDPVHTWSLPM